MLTIGHFVNWVPCEVFAVAFLAFVLGTRMRIGARIGWSVVLAICRGKFPKEWRPNVAAAFASATNGEFRVLLQHQPKDARENIAKHNVDLQLSGHTHGGFMPGISSVISRASNGFIRGLYPIRGRFLHVSPGCGQCAWLPVRFLNPSELTVFVLVRE